MSSRSVSSTMTRPGTDRVARQRLEQPGRAEVGHLERPRREVDAHDPLAVDLARAGGHDLEAGEVELDRAARSGGRREELAGVA